MEAFTDDNNYIELADDSGQHGDKASPDYDITTLSDSFAAICFGKNVFNKATNEQIEAFVRRIGIILKYLHHYFADGKIGKQLLQPKNQKSNNDITLLKARLDGSDRLFFSVYTIDGNRIVHILGINKHDEQSDYIANFVDKGILSAGLVRWPVRDFFQRIAVFQARAVFSASEFQKWFDDDEYYIYDNSQQKAMEQAEKARQLSITGNAGSGKSIVGENWLKQRVISGSVVYMTMSEGLKNSRHDAYWRHNEIRMAQQGKGRKDVQAGQNSRMVFFSIFDFLAGYARKAKSSVKYLTADESYLNFSRIVRDAAEIITKKETNRKLLKDEGARRGMWRKIHGIVSGALPGRMDIDAADKNCIAYWKRIDDCIDKEEYQRQYAALYGKRDTYDLDFLYAVYEYYHRELQRMGCGDDNDLARYILRNCAACEDYDAAFIDECQDLTNVGLAAIFYLLRKCRHRMMSSDRCQIVQPTFFDDGIMRFIASVSIGPDAKGVQSIHFTYNYRSVKEIVEFQRYIIHKINDIWTLKARELADVRAIIASHVKPLWIASGPENRHRLLEKWQSVDDVELQMILPHIRYTGSKEADREIREAIEKDGRLVYDAVTCKGMEFANVLLWNILSCNLQQAGSYEEWAWQYFYVAATRAQQRIIIYEEWDEQNTCIRSFLQAGVAQGVLARTDSVSMHTLDGMLDNLSESDYLRRAKELQVVGSYSEAIKILERLSGDHKREIEVCRAREQIALGKYGKGLEIYIELGVEKTYIEEIMQKQSVDEQTYFACLLYCHRDEMDAGDVKVIYKEFWERFPDYDENQMGRLLGQVCCSYDQLNKEVLNYLNNCMTNAYCLGMDLADKLNPPFLQAHTRRNKL